MKAYLYDEETKEFISEVNAQIDPLESEIKGETVYLLPANATFKEPLEEKEGFKIIFSNDNDWEYQEIKTEIDEIPEPEITNEDISNMRQSAYVARTDPLTLRKLRKLALNEWTEEDETQYVSEIQAISKEIAEEYPYKE